MNRIKANTSQFDAPSYRPTASTIAAFWVVVGMGQEQMDAWLADHPNDAPWLRRLLIAGT
jgi:hypothetical protein